MSKAAQKTLFSTAEKEFRKLTADRYKAMVKRFAERRDKNERIYRVGREIPFSLDQFQAWALEQLGGAFDGATRCFYGCGTWINVQTMVLDHEEPVSRGGSLGLENLRACCEACNDFKGGLDKRWFDFTKRCLDEMPIWVRQEITSRLRKAVKLAAGVRWGRKKAAKKQAATQATVEEDF